MAVNFAQLLQQYQQENPKPQTTPPETVEPQPTSTGNRVFEINSKSEIDFIPINEKSGQLLVFVCEPENRVYLGRYNFSQKKVQITKTFIFEEDIPTAPDDNGMGKLLEVLTAFASTVDEMKADIKDFKTLKTSINKLGKEIKDVRANVENPVESVKKSKTIKKTPQKNLFEEDF